MHMPAPFSTSSNRRLLELPNSPVAGVHAPTPLARDQNTCTVPRLRRPCGLRPPHGLPLLYGDALLSRSARSLARVGGSAEGLRRRCGAGGSVAR